MTQKLKVGSSDRVIILGSLLLISVLISINHFIIHVNSKTSNTHENQGIYDNNNIFDKHYATEHNSYEYNENIYMDWNAHSDKFGYLNYKSLESLVFSYPRAKIVVLHLGPTAADYYKFGNMISKHIFQKYDKFGKNVAVDIQGFGKLFRTDIVYGYNYWEKEVDKCCNHKSRKDFQEAINRYLPPFHLFIFQRLLNLYKSGGIYSDFSFLHMVPNPNMVKAQHGFILITNCDEDRSTISKDCTTSMLLKFQKQSPVLKCVLIQYDNIHYNDQQFVPKRFNYSFGNYSTFSSCIDYSTNGGIDCILTLFEKCFSLTNTKNDMNFSIIDVYDDISGFNVYPSSLMSNVIDFSDSMDVHIPSIIWLGKKAYSGHWDVKPEIHNITSCLLKSNIREQHNYVQKSRVIADGCEFKLPNCSHYSTEISDNYKYSMQELRQAHLSCTISFVVAGFMKAGSSYLYNLLTSHPQIVKLLRGVAFKESGCYLPDSMRGKKSPARMNCFPFIEQGEMFIYGDATVNYAVRKEVPKFLHQDNPNIKAIFIIRDPIVRTLSHHKFSYGGFTRELKGMSDINDIIAYALDPAQPGGLMTLHSLAAEAVNDIKNNRVSFHNSSAIKKLMDQYKRGLQGANIGKYRIAANLIIHSIYFPAIYNWADIIGKNNIFIISGEILNPSSSNIQNLHNFKNKSSNDVNLNYHMNNMFKFIGLCPRKPFVNSGNIDSHVTYSFLADYVKINSTTSANLSSFFKPFNLLLQNFVLDMKSNAFIRHY